jgi:GNAT superfamily N-acetyltransferase
MENSLQYNSRGVAETDRIRPATLADIDVLVRHRLGMFADMGVTVDQSVAPSFRAWLFEMMPPGTYRAWLIETATAEVAAGGGITILPWPPGPRYPTGRLAFVYNVYTEPAHRRRGHARRIMETIHAWCREAGITSLALNASQEGRPLYDALGYHIAQSPMMFFGLDIGPKV